jgi:methionyl-tRNA formyltransferase
MLAASAERLAAEGHRIVCVVACAPAPDYGGSVADFEQLAQRHSAPFLYSHALDSAEVVTLLYSARPDIGISAGWPSRIDERTRDLFPFGILNIHGGDLPRYRGNAPFAWAILQGEPHAGITVHLMDDGLDSGPVLCKVMVPLSADTYIGDLYARMEQEAPALFLRAVEGLETRTITPEPQTGPTLTGFSRRPEDGRIQWGRGADDIARLVRCSSEPLAGAFARFDGQLIRVWRARVQREATVTAYPKPTRLAVPGQVLSVWDSSVSVHCGGSHEALLLDVVQMPNGDRQPAAAVLRSLRDRLHNG